MGKVGLCTERTAELLTVSGAEVRMEWNPGGHFTEPEERLRKAAAWLIGS